MPLTEAYATRDRRTAATLTVDALAKSFAAEVPIFSSLGVSVEYLLPEHHADLLVFRGEVFAGLADPDLVLPEPDEASYVEKLLAPPNVVIGLRQQTTRRLMGYGSVVFPEIESELVELSGIGRDYRVRAAEIASCMLHRDIRGHRLQRAFLSARERIAWAAGRTYLQVMTSPKNGPSRHNLLVAGYTLDWAGIVPSPERVRLILAKDLLAKRREAPKPATSSPRLGADLNTRTARLKILRPDDSLRVGVNDAVGLDRAVNEGWISFVDDWKAGELVFYRPSSSGASGKRIRPSLAALMTDAVVEQRQHVIEHILHRHRAQLFACDGETLQRLLILATRSGAVDVVGAILTAGFPLADAMDVAVAAAAATGNDDALRLLLENGGSVRAGFEGRPAGALLEAARLGNSVSLELLLKYAKPGGGFTLDELAQAKSKSSPSLSFAASLALHHAMSLAVQGERESSQSRAP